MNIDHIPIEIRALLGQAKLKLSEISVGDVIILDQKVDEPLIIQIGKKKTIKAFPCSIKGKKGIKIKRLYEPN